ncbi:N-acetylglucosamine-6-phosphate deacetylase [Caulifigura coniformis]|uniref:N-acetylglucosamine-6-phosphate deacetylase n=2 Tax=Caulifigura coniformis TaxID=2527983 RepID=A0A517S7S0_9PLAN|nr:N-acetylglucosamine-6-phosphate deacetylase [Caulifigura coniformis]
MRRVNEFRGPGASLAAFDRILPASRLRQALPILALVLALLPGGTVPQAAGPTQRAAGFQVDCIAIRDARVVIEPGEELDSATVVIRRGLIESVGKDVAPPADARVIDGKGSVVYAGFIDAARDDLWNRENGPQPQKRRSPESGRFAFAGMPEDNRRGITPEFQVATQLTVSSSAESLRKLGFTTAHAIRAEPILAGEGCVVALSGAPPRESLLPATRFQSLDMSPPPRSSAPESSSRRTASQEEGYAYPTVGLGVFAHLRQAMLDAERSRKHQALYAKGVEGVARPPQDDVLDAINDLLEGRTRALFRAESADRIDRALDFAAEFQFKPVLWGGHSAADRVERIREAGAPVVFEIDFGDSPEEIEKKNKLKKPEAGKLADEFAAPQRVRESRQAEWTLRVSGPAKIASAKVPFAFSSKNLKEGELFSNLRKAIKEGLSKEDALAGLTTNAAAILGLGERAGTLEKGRWGNVVVLSKPLEQEGTKVRYVIADGYLFEYAKDDSRKEDAPAGDKVDDLPADASALAGEWKLAIAAGEMTTTEGTLSLKSSGSRFEGEFTSPTGSGRVLGGSLAGQNVKFRVEIGAGSKQIELKFAGKQTGSKDEPKLEGTLESPFGAPARWSATKKPSTAVENSDPKKTDEKPPVKLALDDDSEKTAKPEPNIDLPTETPADRRQRHVKPTGNLFLKGGTIITGTGEVLKNSSIIVRGGKIAAIGKDVTPDEGMDVIDLAGLWVMPGMIDTHSHIMLRGNTSGINESSESITCEVRVGDVLQSDDPNEYRALAGGLTTVRLLHGSANSIGGQHAIVKLKVGESAKNHLMPDVPPGVKFALGENVKFRTGRFPNTRLGVEATIKRAFYEGLDYRREWMHFEEARKAAGDKADDLLPPRRDLRLETLAAIVSGENFIHSHCYRADEILMLLRAAEEVGVRVRSLQHVLEGYKIAPEIAAHGASCSTFSDWWAYKIEAYDAVPYNTTVLNKAGINTVIKSDDAELMRHMNLEAAKSLRYGNMPWQDALRMVTVNAAKELGIFDRVGSLEVGKDADLAIFNGHPFNGFTRCEMTVIEGNVVFQRAKQPSAMSPAAAARGPAKPGMGLAKKDVRARKFDLPAGKPGLYAITGATIHPVDGPAISEGVVLIDGDRIAAVGKDVTIPENAGLIDAAGLHVYPGLIDAGTTLGLSEVAKVVETVDAAEIGRLQPDLRAGISVNAESELIPVNRAGGVTMALVQPVGGLVCGHASLVQTGGWTAEKMVRNYYAGLRLNWPDDSKSVEDISDFFAEAKLYDAARTRDETAAKSGERSATPIVMDPRYEAMRPCLKKERPLLIEANTRKHMAQALNFAAEQDVKVILTGASDAWKMADVLAERKVPCILGRTMRVPVDSFDPFDATYANAGRLHEAGVEFCFRSDQPTNSRNVAFEAGIAVAYGLPEEEALKGVTLSTAKILGLGDQTGSITKGKLADLVITDGNPLQPTTQIKGVFVAGMPYEPTSKQTRLFEKYMQRLE